MIPSIARVSVEDDSRKGRIGNEAGECPLEGGHLPEQIARRIVDGGHKGIPLPIAIPET